MDRSKVLAERGRDALMDDLLQRLRARQEARRARRADGQGHDGTASIVLALWRRGHSARRMSIGEKIGTSRGSTANPSPWSRGIRAAHHSPAARTARVAERCAAVAALARVPDEPAATASRDDAWRRRISRSWTRRGRSCPSGRRTRCGSGRRTAAATRVLDVREKEEYREGHLPGAVSVPRGFLEMRVEEAVPDKTHADHRLLRRRHALAARRPHAEGAWATRNVVSMTRRLRRLEERRATRGSRTASSRPSSSDRYSRHFLLPEVGEAGQAKLLDAKVLLHRRRRPRLAGGVLPRRGRRRHARHRRHDVVDLSNLQRQILHTNDRVGMPKVESARQTLKALNPDVKVDRLPGAPDLRERHASSSRDYDVIVDGCDNFPTRYLVNDACVMLEQAERARQHLPVRGPGDGLRPAARAPATAASSPSRRRRARRRAAQEAGVLGVLPGLVGCVQALETIKLILGVGKPLIGRMVHFDTLSMEVRIHKLRKDPELPGVRRAPDGHRADRLRGVLRPARSGDAPRIRNRCDRGGRRRACARHWRERVHVAAIRSGCAPRPKRVIHAGCVRCDSRDRRWTSRRQCRHGADATSAARRGGGETGQASEERPWRRQRSLHDRRGGRSHPQLRRAPRACASTRCARRPRRAPGIRPRASPPPIWSRRSSSTSCATTRRIPAIRPAIASCCRRGTRRRCSTPRGPRPAPFRSSSC